MIEFVKTTEDGGIVSDKASGIRHIAIAVDDFVSMVEKLTADMVKVVSEPTVSSKGIKTFFFRDPEDNVLHLIYRPEPL
jgi:extradiol dioxygenase family protein